MKNWLRYTLSGIFVAVAVTVAALVLSSVRRDRASLSCSGIEVVMLGPERFIDEEDIRNLVYERYGIYVGVGLNELDLAKVEEVVSLQPMVRKCDAWLTGDGILHLKVRQRTPVMKLMKGEEGFYADASGALFPLSEKYTAEVPVIEGSLDPDPERIAGLLKFVRYTSRTWSSRISGIRTDARGELVLRIDDGPEEYLFGRCEGFDDKFSKIDSYLGRIKDGNDYTSVNLKYRNQIICK